MRILGISAYYHDSAAALLRDGELVAAAQEERFTRKKHDAAFPVNAIRFLLEKEGCTIQDLDAVIFYDKPFLKFERLLETYVGLAPRGFPSFLKAMPVWLKEKVFLKSEIKKELAAIAGCKPSEVPSLYFSEHHQSHAASAFFPSPYEKAVVLCLDGVGEWATTSAWRGEGNQLEPLWEISFPHSVGLLYSAFTYYAGFKVNSGEYKLMGLAPYGEPKYRDLILEKLIDLRPDGTYRLRMEYFNYATGLTMTSEKFHELFGGPPRKPESRITQKEMDLARSIQVVTEEIVLRLARTLASETGLDSLCLAGGVALNCVANGRLWREGPFKKIWVQPAAGDAGGAIGAAFALWHQKFAKPRASTPTGEDRMRGSYLGTRYTSDQAEAQLKAAGAVYQRLAPDALAPRLAEILESGAVVGWFQGPMEFGPRALGGRSIIGDPRNPKLQSVMNLKIKYRESFRPFAPAVLAEDVSEYFEYEGVSPYMLMVAPVRKERRIPMTAEQEKLFGIDKLNVPRSVIPAVTHVDYSARLQTVHRDTNPRFHSLLSAFKERTGCGVLINTSFNVRGEPIVESPSDAYRCFMRTEMDYLVVEDCLIAKTDQPASTDSKEWMKEFELD